MAHCLGCDQVMASSDHINPDQHMNFGHIKSIVQHKEVRQMLGKLVDNDVKFLLSDGGKHHQLKIIGNGIVHLSKTPGDRRAIKEMEGDIRRGIRKDIDPEWKFPK